MCFSQLSSNGTSFSIYAARCLSSQGLVPFHFLPAAIAMSVVISGICPITILEILAVFLIRHEWIVSDHGMGSEFSQSGPLLAAFLHCLDALNEGPWLILIFAVVAAVVNTHVLESWRFQVAAELPKFICLSSASKRYIRNLDELSCIKVRYRVEKKGSFRFGKINFGFSSSRKRLAK